MEKAYNPKTGEFVFYNGQEWVKPEQSAVNEKTGEVAYLVGNQWQEVGKPPKKETELDMSGELKKGAQLGVESIKALPNTLSLYRDTKAVQSLTDQLAAYDKVDKGIFSKDADLSERRMYPAAVRSYMNASDEKKQELRAQALGKIQEKAPSIQESMQIYMQFVKDTEKYKAKTGNLTDVENAKDFGNWLGHTFGSSAVQLAPTMLAAITTGGLGAFAVGTAMSMQETMGNRIGYIQERVKGLPPKEQADAIIAYLEKTGNSTALISLASGSLDLFGPVGAIVRKRLAGEGFKDLTLGKASKEIGKQTGEEALTGAGQESIQIGGEFGLKEQAGDVFSKKNVKRVIDASAQEAAGGFLGASANVGARGAKNAYEVAEEKLAPERVFARAFDDVVKGTDFNPQATRREAALRMSADIQRGLLPPESRYVGQQEEQAPPTAPAGTPSGEGLPEEDLFGATNIGGISEDEIQQQEEPITEQPPPIAAPIQTSITPQAAPLAPALATPSVAPLAAPPVSPLATTPIQQMPPVAPAEIQPPAAPPALQAMPSPPSLPPIAPITAPPTVNIAPPVINVAPQRVTPVTPPVAAPIIETPVIENEAPKIEIPKETPEQKRMRIEGAKEEKDTPSKNLLRLITSLGGIDKALALDIAGDKGMKGLGPAGLKLFRTPQFQGSHAVVGFGVDELARKLVENGWMSPQELQDVDGGAQRAKDLVRDALDGRLQPVKDEDIQKSFDRRAAEEAARYEEEHNAAVADAMATITPQDKDYLEAEHGNLSDYEFELKLIEQAKLRKANNELASLEGNEEVIEIPSSEQNLSVDMFGNAPTEKVDEERARIDRESEVPYFLTPPEGSVSPQPLNEPKSQRDLPIDRTSKEYKAALEVSRKATSEFARAQQAYRKKEINDKEFLDAKKLHDKAMAEFDKAERKENGESPDVKGETEFIEKKVKGTAKEISSDFMVGDSVRFGNSPGVVVGLEGDYVRFRPDSASNPKAYQRVQKSFLTMVSRPDQAGKIATSKEQDNKFGEEKGQLGADMGGLIQLLGANMYAANLADVSIKELLQNSFDAVKGAISDKKGKSLYKVGKITVNVDYDNRTITLMDNARGMTPEIVRNAFFTVAGSDKSDLDPSERSGGLGLAKMGFMLGSERLILDTVRDGVRVTVDTTSKDIANSNFKIQKSPAPKSEHGTSVTVKIPESYIDTKNGESRTIWFPYGLESIDPLNKPLIGPVEVTLNFQKFGEKTSEKLPIGVNFPYKDYQNFKVNFSWGSADVYFGVERKENSTHQVLSSGVFQFANRPRFTIGNEQIPYDIIVDIKPNVDAKHPDYPFENSRERLKGRLEKDVESLNQYLAKIALGNEALNLQDSFKGIVSMPRVEAGQDLVETSKKLKKVFDQRGAKAGRRELPQLPKEVTIQNEKVTDSGGRVLVDLKKKEEEKKNKSTFKAEKEAPTRDEFMIEMDQDPNKPIFHNNTNIDYIEIGKEFGNPEQFFAELGTLVVEMKEELAKSGIFSYSKLQNLFFAGISVDKGYGGVHIKVPYKAILINPFYDWGAKSLFGIRQNFLNTMIHEIAHTGSMDHGVAHNGQMIKVEQYLADEGMLDYYRDAILDILRRHESTFTAMREAYGKSTTKNTSKSLEDNDKNAGSASARGDGSRSENAPNTIPSGERLGGRGDIRKNATANQGREVGEGTRGYGVENKPKIDLYDIETKVNTEQKFTEEELAVISPKIREEQIRTYAGLRRRIMSAAGKVAAGEVSTDLQRRLIDLIGASKDLKFAIEATRPVRSSSQTFMAKALSEYDKGNISAEVLGVIEAAYSKYPELLEGLRLSVVAPKSADSKSAGNFGSVSRIVRLFKTTSGVENSTTIRHELTHSLEQMMTNIQRQAVYGAWLKDLQKAVKNAKGDKAKLNYLEAVINFIENPSRSNHEKAMELLPSYDMYQFINPSEYWAVNAEKLLGSQLGGAWQRFKLFVKRLFEGLKSVLGFDNQYPVHKVFNQIMSGEKTRISHSQLVDMVTNDIDFKNLNNRKDDLELVDKYNRAKTPMIDKTPIKNALITSKNYLKNTFKDFSKNPIQASMNFGNSVDRGITYLRNKNIWFGTGLNLEDQKKYGGMLRDSDGMAIASMALDNALRGGNIAAQVVLQGGIKWNAKSLNFVATKTNKGMVGVYKAEKVLQDRLGDQLATDIINGYLEAKRSLSIRNESSAAEAALAAAENNFISVSTDPASTKAKITSAKNQVVEAKDHLTSVKIALSKVAMSEEEQDAFIAREKAHPELKDIMENWTAINQNLLRFWKQVGMLSEGRYKTLSGIKDYVPWQRIMNDEEDIHSPNQTTTKSMTNIGREKLYKKGAPVNIIDFIAEKDQTRFEIPPSRSVVVEVNGKTIPESEYTISRDGEVELLRKVNKGDLILFKGVREIDNIIDNMTKNVMRMTMNGLRQHAAIRMVKDYATRDANGKIMTFAKDDPSVGRMNWIANGRRVVIEIKDPLVKEAMIGMESLNLTMFKPLIAAANFTRRAITLSGAFQLKQVFKDAPTAALVTGVKRPDLLIGGVYKGFITALTNTDPVVDILRAAGIGGFHSPSRTPEAEVKKRIGVMNKNVYDVTMSAIDHFGDSSDMAQRVATYKRVLAETGDEAQALYAAANVINFLRHGSSQLAQTVVKTVPFMGAWANSIDVLYTALAGGGLKGKDRASAIKQIAITGTLLAMTTLAYCMMVSGDKDYEELDDDTKLRNVVIPGTSVMLPMNTSAAFGFFALTVSAYNYVTKHGTEKEVDRRRLIQSISRAFMDSHFGPEPVPSLIKPFIEIALKHNFFTGREITPKSLENLDKAQQYTATTSEAGKYLSSMLSVAGQRAINPIEADHLIRSLTGSIGGFVQWYSNVLGEASENRVAMSPKQYPFVGAFIKPEVPRGNLDLFYDFKNVVENKNSTFESYIRQGKTEQAKAYGKENEAIIGWYDYVQEMEKDINETNALIREIGESSDKKLTPKLKAEYINILQKAKNAELAGIEKIRKAANLPNIIDN